MVSGKLTYYYNGQQISEREAAQFFNHYWSDRGLDDIAQAWSDCQSEEDSRDIYLPPELEIVAQ